MNSSENARRWAWLAVFLPFVLLAALRIPEGPRVEEEDFAHYLLHAEAIAEGRAYTDIGFIPTQLSPYGGPTARPPGLPLILAPVVQAGGTDSPLLPLLSIGMALAFLIFAARAVGKREPALIAMAVGLLSGLQPEILHFAPEPLSDLPFAALVWAVILLCEAEEPWSGWRLLLVTPAGAAAISIRLAGVALIPAMAAYGVLHFRRQGLRTLVPVAVWCATFWLTTSLLPTTDAPMTSGAHGEPAAFAVLIGLAQTYGFGLLDALLYPFGIGVLDKIYHLVALALLGIGAVSAFRTYWRTFVGLFSGTYVAMLLVIPVRDLRYLYPLIPVVIFLTVHGLLVTLRRLRPALTEQRRVLIVAVAAVTVGMLASWTQWKPVRAGGVAAHADARALFEVLRPLAASPGTRLNTFKPHVVTLETGVPAMPILQAAPDRIVGEFCARRITHVVVGSLGLFDKETEQMRRAIAEFPAMFREVFRNASFGLWRFESACGAAITPREAPTAP
jgi:hypothetical protein